MAKWLIFKKAVKKGWIWLKTHWYLPLIFLCLVIALLIWVVFKNGMLMALLYDVLESSRDSYEDQIKVLEGVHEKESKDKDAAVEKYLEDLETYEKEFGDHKSSLSAEKEAALRKLMNDSAADPDKLAREIGKLWGIDENG